MFDDLNITYTGEKDKTTTRKGLERIGGGHGFRTLIIKTPEGVKRLNTRGGFPELISEPKKKEVVAPQVGWDETDFNLRTYGDPVLTKLSPAMGGFYALVRPITSVDMDGGDEGLFKLKPNVKIETNL